MIHLKDKKIELNKKSAITLGNFDGIHRGHQRLIENIVNYSKTHKDDDVQALVFSFNPHPRSIFTGEALPHILTPEEKIKKMEAMGVDIFLEYPFDIEFSGVDPETFLQVLLKETLNCAYITVGENYRFGRKGEGDIHLLKAFAQKNGIDVQIEQVMNLEETNMQISSTNIKKALEEGNIPLANKMLGYEFFYEGVVEYGKQIGHTIGFPTANLAHGTYKLDPHLGVYVTHTIVDGKEHLSVTNVGDNPTVNGDKIVIETHIMGFEQDIYGKEIKVKFFEKIRDQKKFASLDELKKQIDLDSAYACNWQKNVDINRINP